MKLRLLLGIGLAGGLSLHAAERTATDDASLRAVLPLLAKGDVLKIGLGDYSAGWSVTGIADLTVEALNPERPPHFRGGKEAWHFTRCPGLKLRHLVCSGQSGNGVNLDDGGPSGTRVTGVVIEDLEISDIGPVGNFDAIKCSGLDDLVIRRCSISGWGGQAIDLVGCHRVTISDCRITGKEGFSQHTGPQFKGGCSDITLEKCVLTNAGARPVQAGGSTGVNWFRPLDAPWEAARVTIRDNVIEGGECACAFTGVEGAEFSRNTILRPGKWIFRVLQESQDARFRKCGNVTIAENRIVFRRAEVSSEVNVGDGVAIDTFRFRANRWLAEDRPDRSAPRLPVKEEGGVYGEK